MPNHFLRENLTQIYEIRSRLRARILCAYMGPTGRINPRLPPNGPGGSRTHVWKTVFCSSTSVACPFSFPLSCGERHPHDFSRFIFSFGPANLRGQSALSDRCQVLERQATSSLTAALRQRLLNYLQRLILIWNLTHPLRLASPASYPPSKPLLAPIAAAAHLAAAAMISDSSKRLSPPAGSVRPEKERTVVKFVCDSSHPFR